MPLHRSLRLAVLALPVAAWGQGAGPVRDVAFARDGRLAASIEGDVWVRGKNGGSWERITSGPAWDRQPAWSFDGTELVFVSNREGQDDLFRVKAARGATATRITTDPAADQDPSVG